MPASPLALRRPPVPSWICLALVGLTLTTAALSPPAAGAVGDGPLARAPAHAVDQPGFHADAHAILNTSLVVPPAATVQRIGEGVPSCKGVVRPAAPLGGTNRIRFHVRRAAPGPSVPLYCIHQVYLL